MLCLLLHLLTSTIFSLLLFSHLFSFLLSLILSSPLISSPHLCSLLILNNLHAPTLYCFVWISMDSCLHQWDVKPFRAGGASRLERSFVGGKHGAEKLLLKCSWSPDQQKVACGSADRCSIISYQITSQHIKSYHIMSHNIISHHITSHHVRHIIHGEWLLVANMFYYVFKVNVRTLQIMLNDFTLFN